LTLRHEVALHVFRDTLEWLTGVLGDDLFEARLDVDHLACLNLDVGCLFFEAAGYLADQDRRVLAALPASPSCRR
jgi:hypothetical protein